MDEDLARSLDDLRTQLEAWPTGVPIPDEMVDALRTVICTAIVGLVEARCGWKAPPNVQPWVARSYFILGPAGVQEVRANPIDQEKSVLVRSALEALVTTFDAKAGG